MTVPSDNLEIKVDNSVVLRLQTHESEALEYQLIMDNYDYLKPWVFWVNDKFSRALLHAGIEENLENYRQHKAYVMGVYIDGTLGGFVDVRDITSGNSAEVGYWIAEQFTGNGLATKCTLRLMEYVRERHAVNHFYLLTIVDNIASAHVAERMGFHLESVVDNDEHNIKEKRYVKNYSS